MTAANELYEERLKRIKTAAALEKPDRVPVVPLANAFCARHMGVKMSEFCTNPKISNETIIKSFSRLGEFDGLQSAAFYATGLSTLWLSKVKLPGYDLPENELWQVDERELMTIEDYDAIIDKGYNEFLSDYYRERLDNLEAKLQPLSYMPQAQKNIEDLGIVLFCGGMATIPYESFCGGRSMPAFLKDLFRIPDKVQEAMDVAMVDILENTRQMLRAAKPIAIWTGGWRSASEFLSPRLWNRFVFPYFKQLVQAVVDEGVIAILHFDSDWTRDLEYLRELPKGKCVLALDGATDIFKAKEILGDHMCIMGDVPSSPLSLGTPDEVHDYCRRLINEIGPAGFILSSGCDIPPNAKPENVKAMIDSVK
jgi:uroporphyrinogen-III decarboxylase